MRRLISIVFAFLIFSFIPARGQGDLLVVQSCGTLPLAYLPGRAAPGTQDVNGRACGSSVATATFAPTSTASAYSAVTVGTSAAQVVAAGARVYLDLHNPDVSAGAPTIACAPANITLTAVNQAGSWPLPPGTNKWWEGNFVPSDAINCIASASGAKLTVGSK